MRKMLRKFWESYKSDLFPIIFLISLSFYAWRFLPTWIIQFQGYMYLIPATYTHYLGDPNFLSTAQVAGVLLSAVISKLVGVNFPLYMWIQLIGMLGIGILFYFVVKVITKNRFIAFSASLMYMVNYFGNFDMYIIDYSAHFLERASVNIIFLLLSFLFLHLFLEKTKQKYYIISFVLYFLGVLSSHFSILFTGPYFFYPFFWNIFNKKSLLKGFAIGMSYILISGFFVYLSSVVEPVLSGHESFLQFIIHPQKYRYFEGAAMQFVNWSQYPSVIKGLLAGLSPLAFFDPISAASLMPSIVFLYIAATFIIYKTFVKERVLLLTTIFGTVSIFMFNIYLGRYDPLYSVDSNRYLYFPTYLLAIFWSLFLWVLLKNKNLGLRIAGIVLLTSYYLININLLSIRFAHFDSDATSQKAFFKYIIENRDKVKKNTLFIAPYPDIAQYEGPFFTHHLGRGQVRYMSDVPTISDWPTAASSSSHVIRLKFDTMCQCVVEEKLK